ncbi:lipocalin family protein [Acinetobacter piscicola]|nr:lipocalin family protein [Acinetobacter piscicola]
MNLIKKIPIICPKNSQIFLQCILLASVAMSSSLYAQDRSLPTVPRVELDKYLGLWYEIARKPLFYQKDCHKNVTARYTINEYGNVEVDNRCLNREGNELRSLGEGFVSNAPYNSKIKVSFLPETIRWMPFGRGDYWILKIDPQYQMALVGEPKRKYLWVLSRTPHPDEQKVTEYLRYAQTLGFSIKDLVRSEQTQP